MIKRIQGRGKMECDRKQAGKIINALQMGASNPISKDCGLTAIVPILVIYLIII